MAALKKYFDNKKEAITVMKHRNGTSQTNGVYKIKHGRNKGKYFVGQYIEWFNLY